jgi:hypothetical protein
MGAVTVIGMSSPPGDAGEVRDPTRLHPRRWYVMSGGWSLLLTPWLYVGATSGHPIVVRVLLVLAVLAYIACFVFGLYEALQRKQLLFSAALIVGMCVLWLVTAAGFGAQDGAVYTVGYLLVTVIALVPAPWTTVAAVLAFCGAVGFDWLVGDGLTGTDVFGMAAISIAMRGQFWLVRANSQLREAREELARLAVAAERAHVVREGATNTIRHSGAGSCTVRLTPTSVEVVDDGVGSPDGTPAGHGLSGLSERLTATEGWVHAGPTPTGGYRLRAEVVPRTAPVRRPEPAG